MTLNKPGSFIVWFEGGGLSESVLEETNIDLQIYKAFSDADIMLLLKILGMDPCHVRPMALSAFRLDTLVRTR